MTKAFIIVWADEPSVDRDEVSSVIRVFSSEDKRDDFMLNMFKDYIEGCEPDFFNNPNDLTKESMLQHPQWDEFSECYAFCDEVELDPTWE